MNNDYSQNNVNNFNNAFAANDTSDIIKKLKQNVEDPYQSSELQQETKSAREEALYNNLSGTPAIPQGLTLPEKKPDLSETPVTKSFTVRDQVMSKIGLMDENYNYTDTYTNYVQKGGQPVPGYEYAHKELLDQERYDRIFQKVDNGEVSYDTALLDAYGKDVMATAFGMDMTSVAYWQNKFFNKDYSNPFSNRYLMAQVLQECESFHQSRLAGEYAKKDVASTQMASLVGEDLTAKQIQDIFGSSEAWNDTLKGMDDTKLLKAVHTGAIDSSLRLTQADDGTYYYLHTDGQLYKLDNQSGDGHAKFTLNSDGTVKDIEIGGTYIKSFTSGFVGVFTGLAKLCTNIVQFAGEGVSVIFDHDFDLDNATSWATGIDNYLADNVNWAVDSGYIDFDSDFTWKDAGHLGANLVGTVLGTLALGGIAGAIGDAGAAMSTAEGASKTAIATGKIMQFTGQAFRWSTGNFGDYALGQSAAHVWGMRAGAAGTFAFKNMLQDVNKMNQQRMVSNDPSKISDGQIFKRALETNAINFGIDLAISGGISDNQFQAWFGRNTLSKSATDEWKSYCAKYLVSDMSDDVINQAIQSEAFKNFMRSSNHVIAINTTADFLGNMFTAAVSKRANIDNEGNFKKFNAADLSPFHWLDKENISLTLTSAFNSYYYSYRSQKKENGYNVAFNNIRKVSTDIEGAIDAKINKLTDLKDIQALQQIKKEYLDDITNSKQATLEGAILEATDKLNTKISDGKNVAPIIKEAFAKSVDSEKIKIYNEMYNAALANFKASQARAQIVGDALGNNSTFLRNLVKRAWYGFKAETSVGKNIDRNTTQELKTFAHIKEQSEMLGKYLKFADNLDKIVDAQSNPEVKDNMRDKLNFKNGIEFFEDNKDTAMNVCKKFGLNDKDLSRTYFMTVRNDAERDMNYDIVDATYKLANKLGMTTLVDQDTKTYAYQIQDGADFIDTTNRFQTIMQSIVSMSQNEDPVKRAEILSLATDNLEFENAAQKTFFVLNAVDTLKESKVLKDSREAVKLLNSLESFKDSEGNPLFQFTKKDVSRMSNKSISKLMTKYDNLNKVLTAMSVVEDKSKFSSSINFNDPDIQKAVKELIEDSSISTDIKTSLKRALDENQSFFQSGGTQGFKTYIDYAIKSKFTDRVVSPKEGNDIEINAPEDLKRYARMMVGEDIQSDTPLAKEVDTFVNKMLDDWKQVYTNSEVVSMRDNVVILNLDLIRGKYTSKLFNDVEIKGDAAIKDLDDPKNYSNKSFVARELDFKNDLLLNNFSPIKIFDITDQSDRKTLNYILDRLNYNIELTGDRDKDLLTLSSADDMFGVFHHSGDKAVIKMPKAQIDLQEALEEAWDSGTITINGKSIPVTSSANNPIIEYVDANGAKTAKPDIISAVMNNVEIKNIDANIKLKSLPALSMLPFNPREKYDQQVLTTTIFDGIQKLKLKIGKLAGKTEGYMENIPIKSVANLYKQDPDLANYLAIDCIINRVFENKSALPIGNTDYAKLKELGIIDTEDSFWEASSKSSKNNYLVLKDYSDEAKQKMKEYVLSKDFNMYKIFPLIGYTNTEEVNGKDFTTMYSNVKATFQTSSDALPRETLLHTLNYDFPWDNNERDFAKEFFNKFLDGSNDYVYNPIKGHKFKLSESKEIDFDNWDAYYKSIQKSKDPYDILLRTYFEEYNNLVKVPEGQDPENWRLLCRKPEAIEALSSADSLNEDVINRIKAMYSEQVGKFAGGKKTYSDSRIGYVGNSTQIPKGSIPVGTDTLSSIFGREVEYTRTDVDGIEKGFVPTDLDIENAYKAIQDIKVDLEEGRAGMVNSIVAARFNMNNVLKILTSVGGNDGYFAIEDADYLAHLIAENADEILAGGKMNIKYNDGVQDLFKALYNKEADAAAKAIFAQAKRATSIEENITSIKKKVKSNTMREELNNKVAIGTKDNNQNTDIQGDLFLNRLRNEREKNRNNKWNKLADQTETIVDFRKMNEAFLNRKSNDTLFEQRYAGNSIAFNFTKDFNDKGPQFTAVNTYNKMLNDLSGMEGFKSTDEKTKDNVMNSSITLTNIAHGNTIYTGETTEYAVMKPDGSLLDMETWGRSSLSDMLNTVLDNETSLKGCTVINFKHHDADDISALNLSYRYIKNDEDYKDFVNDLYQSWASDNMPMLQKALNTNDVETVYNALYSMDENKFSSLLSNIPRWNISEKEETKAIYESIKPYWDSDKATFYKVYKSAFLDGNTFENKEAAYNSIIKLTNDLIGVEHGYANVSKQERIRLDSAIYGLSRVLLNKNQTEGWDAIRNSVLSTNDLDANVIDAVKEHLKEPTTASSNRLKAILEESPDKRRDILTAFMGLQDSTSNVDVLCRKRSLVNLYNTRYRNKNKTELVTGINGETTKAEPLLKMIDSITNHSENKSGYDMKVSYDVETTLDGTYRPLTISFFGHKYEDGEWKEFEKKYAVDYGVDAKIFIQDQDIKSQPFYKNNAGYRSDIEEYEAGKLPFMKPEDIKADIENFIIPGKTLLIGHNSDKSDSQWLSSIGVFDKNLLSKMHTIDNLMIAATNLKDDRARRILSEQGLLEYFYGKQDNSAHGSMADAKQADALFDTLVTTSYNMNNLKSMEIKDIEDFADSIGLKVTKQDLSELDMVIEKAREENSNYLDYFNQRYNISTDNVARITQAFNYTMLKDYSKLITEVLSTSRDKINLDTDSTSIIKNGSYNKIMPILNFASSDSGAFSGALTAIKDTAKEFYGECTENTILKTIASDSGIQSIKQKLNIPEDASLKDTSVIKTLLGKDISDNELIDKSKLNDFNSLHGTYNFAINMNNMLNDLGIEDQSIRQFLTSNFCTAFDFDKSIEDLDDFVNKLDSTYVESKYDKQFYEILNSAFGNTKALFEIPVKGRYSLITSFNNGETYLDMLSGKQVKADASMAIVSKKYFDRLMGNEDAVNNLAKGTTELYSDLVIHPADGNNKVLIRRLIIVDSDEDFLKIPETVAETMVSRDFDGDHTILIQPNIKAQKVMKEYCDNVYASHNVQEDTLNWLKDHGIYSGDLKDIQKSQIKSVIGRDADIIKLCRDADIALSKGEDISDLTNKFINKATTLIKSSGIANTESKADIKKYLDMALSELWENEFDTSYFETKGRKIKYIQNPATTNSDKHRSYSAKVKQEIDALMQSKINLYTVIDSATGEEQKNLLSLLTPKTINNAYIDMIRNDIYGSKVVTNYFHNINADQAEEFTNYLRASITQDNDYNLKLNTLKKIAPLVNKCLDNIQLNLASDKPGSTEAAIAWYDAMLRGIETESINASSNKLTKELKSEDMKALYKEQEELLAQKEKGVALLNTLKKKHNTMLSQKSSTSDELKFGYELSEAIKAYEGNNLTKYVDDFDGLETCKTFVVTSGWPASQDELLTNNKASNPLHAWVSEAVNFPAFASIMTIKDPKTGRDRKITKGDYLPAGSVLISDVDGKPKVILDNNAKVIGIDKIGRQILLSNEEGLDQTKGITNDGAKGPFNTSYYIDDPEVSLIVNRNSLSEDKLVTSNSNEVRFDADGQEFTKTITGPNGKKYTVTGYYSDNVVPTISENDKDYRIKNGLASVVDRSDNYRIDHLHHMSDSRSVAGATIMGGWYLKVVKDPATGKDTLEYDPTRVQNLISSVEHPERLTQPHNMVDALQYTRMYYVLNNLTEAELQKEFKTNLSKTAIIQNKLSDARVNSEQYNAEINYFLNKYPVDLNTPIKKKLFGSSFNQLLSPEVTTRVDSVTTENNGGKKSINKYSTITEDKVSTQRKTLGKVDSPELFDANLVHQESFDDYNVSALNALRYLLDDSITTSQLIEWTKRGIFNKGLFINNANFSNNYRNTNANYVQERTPGEWAHNYVGDLAKSSVVHKPYYINALTNEGIAPTLTDNKYKINHKTNLSDLKLVENIAKGKVDYPYNNDMLVAKVLHSLGNIKDDMSPNEKVLAYGDKNKYYTISQILPYYGINKDTNELELQTTHPQYYTGKAKDLIKQINSTVKDFNYAYKVFSDDNSNVNKLYSNLDKANLAEKESNYVSMKKDADQTLENIYESLKRGVNPETGEIMTDTKPEDVVRDTSKSPVMQPTIIKDSEKELVFERDPLLMSASGLKEDNPEAINIARAVKKLSSVASYVSQDCLNALTDFERALNKSSITSDQFEKFSTTRRILGIKEFMQDPSLDSSTKEMLGQEYKAALSKFNMTEDSFKSEVENMLLFASKNPNAITAYETYLNKIYDLAKEVRAETGEPTDCLTVYMSPYKATNQATKEVQVYMTVKNILNLDRKDPIKNMEYSMTFDFFDSSKAMVQELSKMYSATSIKDTLLNPELNLSSNENLINKTIAMMDKAISSEQYSIYDGDPERKAQYEEVQSITFDALKEFVPKGLAKEIYRDPKKSITERYQSAFKGISDETTYWQDNFNNTYNKNYSTYSEFLEIANSNDIADGSMKQAAKVVADLYEAKVICMQGIIESSPTFAKQFSEYLNSLAPSGYSLVNAYGQKFERNSFLKPITTTSLSNLRDNVGIAYNSKNEAMWNQFMLEKLMCGEVYVLDNKVADYLNNEVYTAKIGSNLTNTFKKISKMSSSLQMALPSRILNRVFSFTGFDYSMGIAYDLKTLKNIPKARKALTAAFQSKGKNMPPEMIEYFKREGQPIGVTGKDLVTFTEDVSFGKKMDAVLNTLTDPLEFQNHLGRYAIYLTALEGFESGDPNYGPVYSKKDAIDSLPTNEDKAMYVMDYILGSPGGFPKLAKKTSGYMLYATFPMAFTRTIGAYGMSLGKLAREGFTSENAKHWMRTAGNPGLGLIGITLLGSAITAAIADIYGLDEKEKEKLLKKKVTIDPFGTILGGTPTISSSSINPIGNFEEMYITPYTDNETFFGKMFGYANTNLISHLNPAIKTPIEVATGYDLYGSAPIDTKYYYNGTENAIRKLTGFFIGSSTSNAIVDQYKLDAYKEDKGFLDSLLTGLRRGVSTSWGNQKSYKKDTTNYYNNIYKVNNYKYSNYDYNDAELQDLLDANYLNIKRSGTRSYGDYNQDDYKRISNVIRKMINNKEDASAIYSVIIDEYNSGVNEQTLRTVLNNCSIIRKLKQVDTQAYLSTLTPKERASLSAAIEYEERMYPLLDDFFPDSDGKNFKGKYKRKYYNGSGSGGGGRYYPRTSKPYTPKYYPSNGYSHKQYNNSKPSAKIKRVNVEVSPQMAVWTNDYNKVVDPQHWKDQNYNRVKPLNHGGGK